jgi:hypothetical protein
MTTLAEHSAFPLLDQCAEECAAALKLEIGEPATHTLARALLVVNIARAKFKSTDTVLAPARAVEIASNAITTMRDHLVAFRSNSDTTLLTAVDQASNDILSNIPTFHDSASPEELRTLSPAMTTFRSTFESSVASVRARAKQVEKEMATVGEGLASLSAQVSEERQRLSSTISEFQAQFSAAQEGRLNAFSTSMDQQVEKLRALQDEYARKLLDHEGEMSASAKELAEAGTERMNASIKARADEADQMLEKINQSKRDVEALVGVIGNLGVTSGYVTVANSARNSKRLWQITAVLSLIALIGFELWTFVVAAPATEGFTLAYVASRVAIGLSVGLLAAYAATMAERSASAERKNRRLELELQAIDPFLERLPSDKRDEFRLKIGDRCFGQTDIDGASGSKISATMFGQVFRSKEFRELFTEAIKAAK